MKLIRLLKLMGKAVVPYLFGIVFMTVSARMFSVIKSFLVKDVFDMITYRNITLGNIIVKNMIFGSICLIIYIFTSYMYKVESKRGHMNLRENVFKKILKLPMSYFENNHSGDLMSRYFYDTSQATDVYTAKLRRFSAPLISLIVYIIPMLWLNVPLTFCLIAANAVSMLFNIYFTRETKKVRSELSEKNSKMTEQLNNILSGISIIKIFGIGNKICDKYVSINREFSNIDKRNCKISGELESVNTFFDFLCSVVFLCVGVLFTAKGIAGISALAAIYTMYSDFSTQFLLVCKYFPDLMGCLVSAGRIFELLEEDEEQEPPRAEKTDTNAMIEFKNISFSYDDRIILDNFNLAINKGEVTAIAGPSGKGKSTICKLLLGFCLPQKGKIYIEGKSVHDIGLKMIRDIVAYVPQEPYIFNVSIEENIGYGAKNSSKQEIIKAAKAANAHEFIMSKPQGYDTLAGERGNKLSGGEKQRIAIARAILKNSPILLLDEATSALDTDNEKVIQESIKTMMNGKTTLMIAHRPAAIKSADRVIRI
ncbi:MAG: ABC transporter ATP-binding protein [Clostridia bacterium]|nr:ABC transporter ATP-binding protein [Clostridia bacterium]